MSSSRTRAQQGFTLIELLVVISIIAILAGLLLPAVTLVKNKANQTANGNNQKQIVTAMVAYQGDYDGSLPLAYGTAALALTPAAPQAFADAQRTAYNSMEVCAAVTQLPNAIFKAKGQTETGVGGTPGAPKVPKAPIDLASGWSAASNGNGHIAWAYDWCVPGEVASYRIIMADRNNWHKKKVVAVAVDSSLRLLNAVVGVGETANMAAALPAATHGSGLTVNQDSVGCNTDGATDPTTADGIYTSVGDGGAAATAGNNNGSTLLDNRRAWVK